MTKKKSFWGEVKNNFLYLILIVLSLTIMVGFALLGIFVGAVLENINWFLAVIVLTLILIFGGSISIAFGNWLETKLGLN